jgi:hypothetical protein
MASNDLWMEKAFANSHGQLKSKAKSAGEGTMTFARDKYHAKGKTGQQARAAVNAQKSKKKLYGQK